MDKQTYNNGFETEQPKNNYKAEGDEFIKNLKSSSLYCRQFFFDTEVTGEKGKKKPCQIAPLRSKMIYDLKRDFGVDVNPDDFSAILYQTLWAEGSFSTLDSYLGESSFYVWLKKVARNAVMDWLMEEHLIENVRSRTVGNTRLALRSQSPSKCQMIIDDLMIGSKYHRLLTAIYVDRLSEEQIMKKLHFEDVAEYKAAKKAGEDKLKDALLRSVEYSEEDVLRDKTKHAVNVSLEFVANMAEWCKVKTGVNPLSDVFGTDLTDEEVRVKTVEFLYDFSAKLKWSDEDRYIWRQRFVENAAPVEVAKEVGRSRGWLDTRYSRLNKKFEKAIKKWWNSHAA